MLVDNLGEGLSSPRRHRRPVKVTTQCSYR
jgi:hypothetical protein